MAGPILVAELFRQEPVQWALRGDPWLWRDMRERLAGVPCPATADELAALIEAQFEQLTGYPISHPTYFRVEKYDHGGMSGGGIVPEWWREKAIPYLQERQAKLCR